MAGLNMLGAELRGSTVLAWLTGSGLWIISPTIRRLVNKSVASRSMILQLAGQPPGFDTTRRRRPLGADELAAIMVGSIAGIGGGIIRDSLADEVPAVL